MNIFKSLEELILDISKIILPGTWREKKLDTFLFVTQYKPKDKWIWKLNRSYYYTYFDTDYYNMYMSDIDIDEYMKSEKYGIKSEQYQYLISMRDSTVLRIFEEESRIIIKRYAKISKHWEHIEYYGYKHYNEFYQRLDTWYKARYISNKDLVDVSAKMLLQQM